jgi:predicted RNA-binding protein YlqC (UPF0109 family)
LSEAVPSPRELLEFLARGLVAEPDAVSVKESAEEDGSVMLELAVAREDYGNVIGRRGRTASALRTVVKAVSARQGHRVFIDIVD